MNRNYSAIQWVLFVTFLLNLLATVVKLGVGLWSGALSLVADGLDTLFDGLSNVIGLIAVRISSQPPDEEHPYGHRKFETLAALFIAAALFITAWELARGAIEHLLDPQPLIVNWWSIGALVFGGLAQAFTGWWELRKGRELASEILIADARHTIASIGVSIAVLVGFGLVWLGYLWADPLVALLVAGVIAKIGVDTVRENIPALVDRAPLDAQQIGAVVETVAGVESYHRIRNRGLADNVAIDLHVRVSPILSMEEANAIADEVRRRLLALPGVDDVTVHAEAQRGPESATDLYTATRLAAQEIGVTIHEWSVQSIDGQLRLHLHVGVNPNLTLAVAHQMVDQLEQAILQRQPQIQSVHSHIELANADILPSAHVSSGLQQRITGVIEKAVATIPNLSDPHDIQVRQVEGRLFITVETLVDGALSVVEAHELSTRLQEAIRANVPNVGEALVHLEPQEG
ncbi:MAG: cation diffusion facilitator family transporter [Chloroflexi bacterium]|nr:cation diffusion facilitator family transporter [Chloroflexota bacterium]